MKITEDNYDVLKEVQEITTTDYDIRWSNAEEIEGYIEADEMLTMMKDLLIEYHLLQERKEDQEEYCKEYHQPRKINYYEEYGINEREFH